MQDIPTSLFADQMAKIINEDVLGISADETEDKAASAVMFEFGISHAAALPFYDKKGRLVMVIGMDWVNKQDITFIESRFRKYVDKIGRMLTGQPSEEIANLMNRKNYLVRSTNPYRGIPSHVIEYENRQREPQIKTELARPNTLSKKAELLQALKSNN
jgi:CBS-domain-containing membrane protein